MRYEDVPETVNDMVKELITDYFSDLAGCKIKVVFDTKKKITKGKLTLGRIKKANELEKFFTSDMTGDGEGLDYVIFIDKMAWELADQDDRYRLLRHELRHTNVNIDSNSNPYQLRGHTVEDFYTEIRINEDKPRWAEDLAVRTKMAYEEAKNS